MSKLIMTDKMDGSRTALPTSEQRANAVRRIAKHMGQTPDEIRKRLEEGEMVETDFCLYQIEWE
jgi:hypothetical protein